jgi:hypothetical protein
MMQQRLHLRERPYRGDRPGLRRHDHRAQAQSTTPGSTRSCRTPSASAARTHIGPAALQRPEASPQSVPARPPLALDQQGLSLIMRRSRAERSFQWRN